MIGLTFPLPALFALMSAAHSAEPGVQAPEASRHVVFSHGQESGPWGRKISALAELLRTEGHKAQPHNHSNGVTPPLVGITHGAFVKHVPYRTGWMGLAVDPEPAY